jgi:glycosyltransferase involved in cell wall biosynthesis
MTAPEAPMQVHPRFCIVTAVPVTCNAFLRGHVAELARRGQVTLVHSGVADDLAPDLRARARSVRIDIPRAIHPWRDLRALWSLWRFLRRERFDLVQSVTPKAGLLAALAARLARVPVRLHWFTGQVWATRSGPMRRLLRSMDRLIAACSTHCLVDSPSQREFLLDEGVGQPSSLSVLADGSVNGVDVSRFRPDDLARRRVRGSLGLADDARLALFVGRLGREKGVPELARAFAAAARDCDRLHLALVGPDEESLVDLTRAVASALGDRLHVCGSTAEPEHFMAAADFLVLPSHREGFGSVVIEAAACGLPTIGTRIYGLTDAIEDGDTGILVPVGDQRALAEALRRMASDDDMRHRMGQAALRRATDRFTQRRLTDALLDLYARLLGPRFPAIPEVMA